MIDLDSLDGINTIDDSSDVHTLASKPSFSSMSQENGDHLLTCMLITANVGTIFEESTLLELWFQQLKSYLIQVRPQLVAIHCQEVGGKNYESSMKHVSNFTDKIIGDDSIVGHYTRIRIFLDENFESLEKFTALGSLYLVHDSVKNVKLYNFKTAQYESIEGKRVYAGNSTNKAAEHVEKVKFPQELFPECRWSRKGFMRTRWLFNDIKPLDLVNIHLFHDASNLVAMETTPSPYAQNRQRALEYTLDKLSLPLPGTWEQSQNQQNDPSQQQQVPLFIFGDFNFRLDTNKVIQRITEGVPPLVKRSADSNEVLEFVYHRREESCHQDNFVVSNSFRGDKKAKSNIKTTNTTPTATTTTTKAKTNINTNTDTGEDNLDDDRSNHNDSGDSGVVMTVGKKLFDCENLDETFRARKNTEWLQELDNELDSFKSKLFEFKISFSPSYPFKEDITGGYSYMKTRCPAWCDRILFNPAGGNMIYSKNLNQNNNAINNKIESEKKLDILQKDGEVMYRLMGNSVPMGDHKPVLLYCKLNISLNNSATNKTPPSVSSTVTNICDESNSNLIESTAM